MPSGLLTRCFAWKAQTVTVELVLSLDTSFTTKVEIILWRCAREILSSYSTFKHPKLTFAPCIIKAMEAASLQLLMSAWDLTVEILFYLSVSQGKTREAFCQLLGRGWMKRTKGQTSADPISSLQVWQKTGVSQSQRNYLIISIALKEIWAPSSVHTFPESEVTLVLCCWQLLCRISRRKRENGFHWRNLFYC